MKHLGKIVIEFARIAMSSTDWRDKLVRHTTPTGQVNIVKVKSLPTEEQEKYRPFESEYEKKVINLTAQHFSQINDNAKNIANVFETLIKDSDITHSDTIYKNISDVQSKMNYDVNVYTRKLRDDFSELRNKESEKLKTLSSKMPEFQSQINKVKSMDKALLGFNDYKRHHTPIINLHQHIDNTVPSGENSLKLATWKNSDKLIEFFKKWEKITGGVTNANVYLRLLGLIK